MKRPNEQPLQTYLDDLGGPDPDASQRLARAMEQAIGRSEQRRASPTVWLAVAAALVLLPAAAILWLNVDPRQDGVATVQTREAAQELRLFHDGRAMLAAETSVQVLENGAEGARVRLLGGSLTLDVNQAPGAHWIVESGRFEVEAIGTVFTVAHRGADTPDVSVTEGVVVLRGPGLPDAGVQIAAPEATAAASEPRTQPTAQAQPEESAAPVPDAAPASSNDADADAGDRRERPRANAWTQQFRRAMSAGKLGDASAALPAGFPARGLADLSAAEVLDAGDALRAAGQTERAIATYGVVCERFERSGSCGVATFRAALLHARAGNKRAAIEGATRYLAREDAGALARDALGRRMQWRSELGEKAAARADAAQYVKRWPDGPLATTARALLDESAR